MICSCTGDVLCDLVKVITFSEVKVAPWWNSFSLVFLEFVLNLPNLQSVVLSVSQCEPSSSFIAVWLTICINGVLGQLSKLRFAALRTVSNWLMYGNMAP